MNRSLHFRREEPGFYTSQDNATRYSIRKFTDAELGTLWRIEVAALDSEKIDDAAFTYRLAVAELIATEYSALGGFEANAEPDDINGGRSRLEVAAEVAHNAIHVRLGIGE